MNAKPSHTRRLLTAAMAATALLGASLPGPVVAAEPTARQLERFERLKAEAEKAFDEGRFEDARRLYLSAYDTIPDPAVLFNIAYICEKKLDNLELAEGYYERVASNPDAPPELIAKAEGRLAKVRDAIAARKSGPPSDKPPVAPAPKDPAPQTAPELDPDAADSSPWPLVTAASGGALMIAGLSLGAVAFGVESRLEQAEQRRDVARAERLRGSGAGLATGADALFFGGLLAAAGGLAWFFLDAPAPTTSGSAGVVSGGPAWRLTPLVGDGLGLSLGGRL